MGAHFTTGKIAQYVTVPVTTVVRVVTLPKFASQKPTKKAASLSQSILCSTTAACLESLMQSSIKVTSSDVVLTVLIDSGSSDSYINEHVAKQINLKVHQSSKDLSMALTSLTTKVLGHCYADIKLNQQSYPSVRLGVLKDFCSDIILGQDFQKKHKSIIIEFGGAKPELIVHNPTSVCALATASIEEPALFANLLPECKPIASKSRQFSNEDQEKRNGPLTL